MADVDVYDPEKEEIEVKKESPFLTNQEIGVGLWAFVKGILLGVSIYCVIYFGLLSFFTFYFLWKAIAAIAITFLILTALDKAMGEKPSLMKTPVFVAVLIAFMITCFVGYQQEAKAVELHPKVEVQNFELIELKVLGQTYITKKVYAKGQIIKIVSNGEVYETDGASWQKYLGPGEHSETLTGTGNMAFKANSPATIKIY